MSFNNDHDDGGGVLMMMGGGVAVDEGLHTLVDSCCVSIFLWHYFMANIPDVFLHVTGSPCSVSIKPKPRPQQSPGTRTS